MFTVIILTITITLQLVAAYWTLRLIKITGSRKTWLFILSAVILLIIKRSIILLGLQNGGIQILITIIDPFLGLAISVLLVIGIAYIAPLFHSIKESEQKLKHYSENLEELVEQRTVKMIQSSKLAALGTFAAGIAHESRQYMQAVRSNAERILAVKEKYEKRDDFEGYLEFVEERVESIQQSINASNSLINSLLSYSRDDPESYTNVSIKNQIELTLNIIKHSIKQDNIKISQNVKNEQEIFGSEAQIREIIMNLLTNAQYAVRNSKNEIKKLIFV